MTRGRGNGEETSEWRGAAGMTMERRSDDGTAE